MMKTEKGIKDLDVSFTWEGVRYFFNVKDMKRDLTDGGGRPILAVMCKDENGRTGCVNLSPDWMVLHLTMI